MAAESENADDRETPEEDNILATESTESTGTERQRTAEPSPDDAAAEGAEEADGPGQEDGQESGGESGEREDEHLAGRPLATSVFVVDPDGVPDRIDSPFWKACPSFGDGPVGRVRQMSGRRGGESEFRTPEGFAPVRPKTHFSVAHDARWLAFHMSCVEPEMDRVWTRRTAEVGRLDLDDSVEIKLDPYHAHGFHWSFLVTPAGEWEVVPPVGAVAEPECAVEVRTASKGWEALVRVPFVDVGLEGDLRGSPIDGDVWGLAVIRRRREAARGAGRGLREAAGWAGDTPESEEFGHIRFQGGRPVRPVEFTRYAAGGFGVNEICVAFLGEKPGEKAIPPGVEVDVRPARCCPRLRSKDISRCKFRVARPGLYRYSVRIPYAEPPAPTEEELAELEAEVGRELTDEELQERLETRRGSPEYVAGLSFLLPDLWSEVERMEEEADAARVKLEEEGLSVDSKMSAFFKRFEHTLNSVDRYRAPHKKDLLGADLIEKLHGTFDGLRAAVRSELLRAGRLRVASPYNASGQWYLGQLRVRTKHSYGTSTPEELVGRLHAAGMSFCAFADLAEGGDQDGDGEHDWNGDGTVSSKARLMKGSKKEDPPRAVAEDRGREPFVIDYSRSAAEQGKPWVEDNWKLSEPGVFVALRAVEVGPHYPALCIGFPMGSHNGGLPPASALSYDAIDAVQEAGGVAVLCEAPGDLRELPRELANVIGIDVPADGWERLLATGRKVLLFPCSTLDARDLASDEDSPDALPENEPRVGVLAESLTEEGIVKALRRGSFYVTSGPEIMAIEVRGDALKIRTREPCQIIFRGVRAMSTAAGGAGGTAGQVLGGSFGTEAEYRFTGDETYVRAVCLADVLEDGSRVEALTQAFYLADGLPASPVPHPEPDDEWTISKAQEGAEDGASHHGGTESTESN